MKDKHVKLAIENNSIPEETYAKFEVKRGLRNKDGSGVLVGLSRVGSAIGYTLEEQEVVPQQGKLIYRNYTIGELVSGFLSDNRPGFEEVSYLLLFGDLPTKADLDEFNAELANNRALPANFYSEMIVTNCSKDIMNMLARSVLVLYSLDEKPDDISTQNVLRQCISIIAKMPILAAYSCLAMSTKFADKNPQIRESKKELSTAENFLYLFKGEYTPLEAELLDLCLVLHAEHGGGNNSSFTTHVVSSSHTDTYSAIAAAMGSLKGPLHGGANAKARAMMLDIEKNVSDWNNETELKKYLEALMHKKAGDKSGKIYGLGHSVYTLSDPRAILLAERSEQLAKEKGLEKEFNFYKKVEQIGKEVIYGIKGKKKHICTNTDFYSGFVYDAIGIPVEMYTPLFAMARISGWSAHRIEELLSNKRLIRPSYKNVAKSKTYVAMKDR